MWEFYKKSGDLQTDFDRFKQYLKDDFKHYKIISTNSDETVYLIHIDYADGRKRIYHGKIYIQTINGIISVLSYECYDYKREIIIHDIAPYNDKSYYCKGIGSELIDFLKQIAKEKKWLLLKGSLSPNDLQDHGERLIYFYTKKGFTIKDYSMYISYK